MTKRSDGTPNFASRGILSRRKLLLTAGAGLAAAGLPRSRALAQASERPDPKAAAAEGPLVVWHGDQEGDVVEFLKIFTQKTGRADGAAAAAAGRRRSEARGRIPHRHRQRRYLHDVGRRNYGDDAQAEPAGPLHSQRRSTLSSASYRSDEPGWYTSYYINAGPMMYDPRFVKEDEAPKTWTDLLDPRWSGQIGFQNASAGTSYAFWFVMKDILPKDFFEKLTAQKPRAYSSSTQIQQDIERGNLKIGGRVSIFQYVKALRANNPVKAVFPRDRDAIGQSGGGHHRRHQAPECVQNLHRLSHVA